MGILDRKYSRRDDEGPPNPEKFLSSRWVWIGLAILIVVAVAVSMLMPSKPRSLEEGSRLVNINTAMARELESLPGIGPSLAQLVIAGRPYQNVDDLVRVSGIGPRQVEQLRPMLTTTESTRDIRKPPIWKRLTSSVTRAEAVLLVATGVGLLLGLYFIVRWWMRSRSQKMWNERIRSTFDDAERRRWEGHRRDSK